MIAVNTPAVALEISRVGARNLASVLRDGMFGTQLDAYTEGQLGDQLGETVWKGTGEVETKLNQDVTTALPVGEAVAGLAPGLYAMTARVPDAPDDGAAATQWFVITDLGLATLTGTDGLHVFLRALSTALPVEGIPVQLIARDNEILGTATTDARGYVRFDPGLLRGPGGAAPAFVAAQTADGDLAFLDLGDPGFDLSDRGVEGRAAPPPVDVFATTDRGAYRPGETVHATILTRDARADAVAGLPLTAIVQRPDGVEASRQTLPDQGAGGRVMALPLGPDAQRGTWRVRLHADPEAPALASLSFLVEDFVPERIDFTLLLPEGPVRRDAPPTLTVDARLSLWRAGRGSGDRGRHPDHHGPLGSRLRRFRLRPRRRAVSIRLCRPARRPAHRRGRHRGHPAAARGDGAGQPPIAADRHLAPQRRLRPPGGTRDHPPAVARRRPDRPAPAVRRIGRRRRRGAVRGDRPRPHAETHRARFGRLDAVAHRHDLPMVRTRRQLELRADHPPRDGGERHAGPRRRHARPDRDAGGLGAL